MKERRRRGRSVLKADSENAASVGVQSELPGLDALTCARLCDELLGERGVLLGRDYPADDVAAEDVEDDVR